MKITNREMASKCSIYDSTGEIVFYDGQLGAWETPLAKQLEPGVEHEMIVTFRRVGE